MLWCVALPFRLSLETTATQCCWRIWWQDFFSMASWQGHRSLQVTVCHQHCCCRSYACLDCNCKLLSWHGLERRKGSFGYSLSLPAMRQGPFVVEAKPSSSVFPSCILLYKTKGHSIMKLICKTHKRVVEIPHVMVNLCLSWADQNGLDSKCLPGKGWTSCLVISFPFIRIMGENNIWFF